jgi:hypothetical protein
MYRTIRQVARDLLAEARAAGFHQVAVAGDGDLVDVCRLTCIEQSVPIALENSDGNLPVLRVSGASVKLEMPDIKT